MDDASFSGTEIGRRGLLLGAAALAAGGTVVVAGVPAAAAQTPGGDGTTSGEIGAASSPITSTIASPPISGYTYRTVCMYDFEPFNPNGLKTWGGSGVYSAVVGTTMRATVEIPPGALVRDVEYYIYNNSGGNAFPDTFLYVAGQGAISSVGASATIPSNAAAITATRATVSQQGPYPLASRLLVSVSTPSTGTIQINGARVGFTQGASTAGLLDAPVRVYDSRNGQGKIPSGGTRTITLPAGIVGPGVSGVIANITALDAAAAGYLKIWSAAASPPSASAINFPRSLPIANAMIIGVSQSRQIKIFANVSVDVIVDITGTLS